MRRYISEIPIRIFNLSSSGRGKEQNKQCHLASMSAHQMDRHGVYYRVYYQYQIQTFVAVDIIISYHFILKVCRSCFGSTNSPQISQIVEPSSFICLCTSFCNLLRILSHKPSTTWGLSIKSIWST